MRKLLLISLIVSAALAVACPADLRERALSSLTDRVHDLLGRWTTTKRVVHLPEGLYILKENAPFTSGEDTAIFERGREVRKTGDGNGKVVVMVGRLQAVLPEEKITRDPSEVFQIKDSLRQVQLRKLESELSDVMSQMQVAAVELSEAQRRESRAKLYGRLISMETGVEFLQRRHSRLQYKATELRQQITLLGPASTLSASN